MTRIESRKLGVVEGFDITAHLVPDTDSSIDDYEECVYTDEQRSAYLRDEWNYVGTEAVASRAGVELGSAVIFGQEYGLFPGHERWLSPLDGEGDQFANGYGPDLIDEAITEAKATIKKILDCEEAVNW